ncbi:MAG: molybdopterin-guanine dinucleotide biosynthesis protein MobB [Deltaproteobacteria bacterium]|nr:molybdopterin-guanine dinucleotide biosynthesis protein MobB [Deltaproteobacteria bacterium]
MRLRTKFWFEDDIGEPVFGEGRRRILELIDEVGSMQAAAKILNMSYRGVWARVKATEQRLGIKLVETTVGRSKDHGSRLTPEARKLLQDYKILNHKGVTFMNDLFQEVMHGRVSMEPSTIPVIAVVGRGGVGKTALITDLVKEWAKRGRRVGVIRLADEEVDRQDEKDGESMAGAACHLTVGQSEVRMKLASPADLTPESLAANYCLGCDLAVVESRNRQHLPTIEVFTHKSGTGLLTRKSKHLLAVVGDSPSGLKDKPCFNRDDLSPLVELVEEEIMKTVMVARPVELTVNGRRVPLLTFVQDLMANTVIGLVSSLKSCENPHEIRLQIRSLPHADSEEEEAHPQV